MENLIIIKAISTEECTMDSYVFNRFRDFKIEFRDLSELIFVRNEPGAKLVVEKLKKFFEELKPDIVVLLECKYDTPEAILVFLKERKLVHYINSDKLKKKEALRKQGFTY